MKSLEVILREYNCCHTAFRQMKDFSVKSAVAKCPKANWLLWIAGRLCDEFFQDEKIIMRAKLQLMEVVQDKLEAVNNVELIKALGAVHLYITGYYTEEKLLAVKKKISAICDNIRLNDGRDSLEYKLAHLVYLTLCQEYYAHGAMDISIIDNSLQAPALETVHFNLDPFINKFLLLKSKQK